MLQREHVLKQRERKQRALAETIRKDFSERKVRHESELKKVRDTAVLQLQGYETALRLNADRKQLTMVLCGETMCGSQQRRRRGSGRTWTR